MEGWGRAKNRGFPVRSSDESDNDEVGVQVPIVSFLPPYLLVASYFVPP